MSYKPFTINVRTKMETLNHLGWSTRAIAQQIKRHHSTVSRELNRMNNQSLAYEATNAQADYQHNRMQSKPRGKWTKDRVHYLTQTLAATWSSEQIEGRKQTR
ncbi:helix-turn-helix domain-containing protein [Paenibacillus xylanexedens]|uniref:helix-turn-helix domain-containing protein n=1 Tax=Paenibacillus xylanexedens TaxID=528191 RepID=UPI003B018D36